MMEVNSYADNFKATEYLQQYYASVDRDPEEELFTLFHREQVDFYKEYSSKWDIKTARLLEFSGGASIAGLICAAPYVNEITFSAYTAEERKEIELWKSQKEGAYDWSEFFKFAVNKLEKPEQGATTSCNWCYRETMLRQRITTIIGCDICQDYPLSIKQDPFNIISTSHALEAICKTFSEYKAAVKKLVALLKPGGYFTIFGDECETFYMTGQKKWPCLYITLEQMKEALAEAGMMVVVAKRDEASVEQLQNPITSDYKAVLFVAAQKVK